MIKRKALKRIYVTTLVLFIMLIMITIDYMKEEKHTTLVETEYVSNLNTSHLYLLNEDNYLVKVDYLITKNDIKDKVLNIIEELNVNNKKYLPLKGIIPSNTKINSIELDKDTIILDFSKDLLKVNKNMEEKVIESIVYSLIELDDIKNVKILIDGKQLNKLEKKNQFLPILLNETIGINKDYSITSIKDIEKVVIYYVFNNKDKDYYVPVTKYLNSRDSKVKIIIDSLKGSFSSNTNLRSYLSRENNIDFNINNDVLTFTFDSLNEDNLESVTYSLASSIFDSMDINKVIFEVDSKIVDVKTKK